jgi:glutaredoxin
MTQPEVRMYCTPFCPDCARARVWLQHNGVQCKEIDISASLDLREEIAALNHGELHTPTFDIEGEIIEDFQRDLLAKARNIAGQVESE